jgi:hypothetical protein
VKLPVRGGHDKESGRSTTKKKVCVSEAWFSLQLTLRDFRMHGRHKKCTKHFDLNPACNETALNNSALMEGDILMDFKHMMWVRKIDFFV